MKLRIATRQSPLALWQAESVKKLLLRAHPELDCALVPLISSGDLFLKDSLDKIGGKGAFVKELEHALLEGTADIAVHSMKDVPANLPEGLSIGAFLKREDPRDAFLSLTCDKFHTLPLGARVGTSSLRRTALLKHLRPDLTIELLRGNVQTRLSKLEANDFDAVILAAAGLKRLGLESYVTHYFSTEEFLPAITQGILGVEFLSTRTDIAALLSSVDDPETRQMALAERAFNRTLGGACHVPVAGFATLHHDTLHLTGLVANIDGQRIIKDQHQGSSSDAETIGIKLAQKLLDQGAEEILSGYR